jgi:hypothetical protein
LAVQLIRLQLLDGDPEGLRSAQVAGRTTILVGAPWHELKLLLARDEAERPAVYLLVGDPPVSAAPTMFDEAIYIGECDSLADRFAQKHHKAEAAEWSQIYVATAAEDTFNKAHARLVEHLLRLRAEEAGRGLVLTKASSPGSLGGGDEAFAREFVDNVVVLAQVLGVGLFRPKVQLNAPVNAPLPPAHAANPVFRFKYTQQTIPARMTIDGKSFVIIKGSKALARDDAGMLESVRLMRRKAAQAGALTHSSDAKFLEFTSDYPTTSVSAAGSLVYGSACAGPKAWFGESTGKSYEECSVVNAGAFGGAS